MPFGRTNPDGSRKQESVPAITSAGASAGAATAILAGSGHVVVTSGGNNDGVILPATSAPRDLGIEIVVTNTHASDALKIYPETGGTINGGAANAALSLAGAKTATLRLTAAATWWAQVGA